MTAYGTRHAWPATALAALLAATFAACDPGAGAEADGGVAADSGGALDAGTDSGPAAPPEPAFARDAEGGVVILRGTNVEGASKWSPEFLPPTYATAADFERLSRELGMNAVRLLVFWEAVEPAPDTYDDAYLAEVRARIEAAHAAGLSVVVDMHQDFFGRGFDGDGAPRWACDETLYASYTPPAQWFLGYFEPEVEECFDRLWLDADLRARYARMWAHVAEALAGTPGLFAYELINEPSWGTLDAGDFERDALPAAYAEWLDAIREVDPAPYVLLEPASTANVGLPSLLAPPDRERLLYGPHVYPPSLELGTGWTGTLDAALALTARITTDAARMALPAVVGETGGRGDVPGIDAFLDQAYTAFDRDRLSAIQWEGGAGDESTYALFDETGAPSAIARAIARPHPARTAGTPLAWSWDAVARRFELDWDEDDLATGDTRITLPELAFPDGADAALDDGGDTHVDGASLVIPRRGGARHIVVVGR